MVRPTSRVLDSICCNAVLEAFEKAQQWHKALEFAEFMQSERSTMHFLITWSTSESNTQLNPTTCLGDTGRWIQQVTAPTLVVTCWIQQSVCILPCTCTGGRTTPPVRLECKMHTDCWMQQVTTRVGAVLLLLLCEFTRSTSHHTGQQTSLQRKEPESGQPKPRRTP